MKREAVSVPLSVVVSGVGGGGEWDCEGEFIRRYPCYEVGLNMIGEGRPYLEVFLDTFPTALPRLGSVFLGLEIAPSLKENGKAATEGKVERQLIQVNLPSHLLDAFRNARSCV